MKLKRSLFSRDATNTWALLGILVALFASLSQISSARRAFELASLSEIRRDYGTVRANVHLWTPENALALFGENGEASDVTVSRVRAQMEEYFNSVEYICQLYMNRIVGRRVRSMIEMLLGEDLAFVPIVHPKNTVPDDMPGAYWSYLRELNLEEDYPRILSCAQALGNI